MNDPRTPSRSAASPARQPKGQPTGGQFAANANPECETEPDADQPVCTVLSDGTQEWTLDGKRHRIDEPAVIRPSGTEEWYLDGKLHRTNGPAVISSDGSEWWLLFGKLHRTNGPAGARPSETKPWRSPANKNRCPADPPLSIES